MSANVKIYHGNQIGGCVTVITYTPEISPVPARPEPEKQDPSKCMQESRVIRLMIDYGQCRDPIWHQAVYGSRNTQAHDQYPDLLEKIQESQDKSLGGKGAVHPV